MLERYEKAIVRKYKKEWEEKGRAIGRGEFYSTILKSGLIPLSLLSEAADRSEDDILSDIRAYESSITDITY